jgi:hypothetical protein
MGFGLPLLDISLIEILNFLCFFFKKPCLAILSLVFKVWVPYGDIEILYGDIFYKYIGNIGIP